MYGNNFNIPYNYSNMPYGYNLNNIYPNYNSGLNQQSQITPTQVTNTNTNKIFVNGIDDVRSRQLTPNSDFMFLDNDKPILYQKIVDNKGQFEVKAFDIFPHKEEITVSSEYVLKTDFDNLYNEFNKLKEYISKLGGQHESIKEQQSTNTNE